MGKTQTEEGTKFTPQFDKNGLIPCVVQDHTSHQVLMVAYMNQDALDKTLETDEAHYWSRSRKELWHKGATSGFVQKVKDIYTDCDQDCLILRVSIPKQINTNENGTCHTGRKTCFYRKIEKAQNGMVQLKFTED